MKKQEFLVKKSSTVYQNTIKVTHYGKDVLSTADSSAWTPDAGRLTKSLEKPSKRLDIKKLLFRTMPQRTQRTQRFETASTYNLFSKKAQRAH